MPPRLTHFSQLRTEREARKRDLRLNQRESFFSNVTIGSGETFLPAFTLAMGFSQITSGYISAIPYWIASLIQLISPWILTRVGSYKKWVMGLALLQGLCFLPLFFGAYYGKISLTTLFITITVYWICNLASASAWNTWMSAIVPTSLRPSYFASRNRLGYVGFLGALIVAGAFLERLKPRGLELQAFALLFALAGIFRFGSAFCFSRQQEPKFKNVSLQASSWTDVLKNLRSSEAGRLIFMLTLFQVAVNICAPFINPFMLLKLKLSYSGYMGLVATPFIAKIILFPYIAPWAKRVGSYRMIQVSALAAALRPVLWMVSANYSWLVFAQLYDGAVFAIFDLAVTLALFETVGDRERTQVMSIYSLVNAVAIVVGTFIGAQLLKVMGESTKTYMVLFALSAVFRFGGALAIEKTMLRIKSSQLFPARALRKPLLIVLWSKNHMQSRRVPSKAS